MNFPQTVKTYSFGHFQVLILESRLDKKSGLSGAHKTEMCVLIYRCYRTMSTDLLGLHCMCKNGFK